MTPSKEVCVYHTCIHSPRCNFFEVEQHSFFHSQRECECMFSGLDFTTLLPCRGGGTVAAMADG